MLSDADRGAVFASDGYTCAYCGYLDSPALFNLPAGLEVDHRIPIAKGGLDLRWNLTTSCSGCNRQKSSMTDAEYRRWRKANVLLANFGPPDSLLRLLSAH